MKINKLTLLIILLSIIATGYAYQFLPEQIPMHFNTKGEVDRWGNRSSIWLTGSLPLLIYGLMFIIPKIDPRQDSYQKHTKGYSSLASIMALFLISLNWFIIAYSLGYQLNVQTFILTAMGILFIVIGNHLPNARQNYTFGIRNPWTLEDEETWTKTHRAGGFLFVIFGLLSMIMAFVSGKAAIIIFISTVLLGSIGINVYSYLLYKKSHP